MKNRHPDSQPTALGGRSGLTTVSIVILVVILVGVCLGPIQSVYCVLISGKAAGEYPVKGSKPVTVALSPEMNPIRFSAVIRHETSNMLNQSTTFDGSLSLSGAAVWSQEFGVYSDTDDDDENRGTGISVNLDPFTNSKVPIHAFDVAESGDYEFVAVRTESDLTIKKMTLQVRRNVRTVHMPSAIAGFIMFVLGGLIGGFRMIQASKAKYPRKDVR